MATTTTNLGHVTAYAFAKEHGYTGTVEQFGEDQANFATNAALVRQKVTEAESFVHGGTGTRTGEDTDNAEYYANKANVDMLSRVSYSANTLLGSHNLLHIPSTVVNKTINGITFTVNRNAAGEVESIFVPGGQTASGNAELVIATYLDESLFGKLFTGCPSGGGASKYRVYVSEITPPYGYVADDGSGVIIPSDLTNLKITITIASGYTTPAEGLTFLPMIRLATDTDTTFTPYAATNTELTARVNTLEPKVTTLETSSQEIVDALSDLTDDLHDATVDIAGIKAIQVDNGCKNLLPMTVEGIKAANTTGVWDGDSYTYNGVTFTLLTDSYGDIAGIQIYGAATERVLFKLHEKFSDILKDGESYIVNGLEYDGGRNAFLQIISSADTGVTSLPNGYTLSYVSSMATNRIAIRVDSGISANAVSYPMIRRSSITDATFEPYYRTVKQINSDLATLEQSFETYTSTDNDIAVSDTQTLSGSKEGGVRVLEIGGKCEQDTTTGKNLFDKDSVYEGKYIDSNGEMVTGGFTATDYIKVNSNFTISGYTTRNTSARLALYDESKNFISSFSHYDTVPNTFTVPSNCAYVRVSVASSDLSNFQLELGSTATDYEPYTGGIPSPNPSYPQSIKSVVVDGVRTCGKNLFDKSKAIDGASISVNNGNPYGSSTACITDYIPVQGQTSIICNTGSNSNQLWGAYYDENKDFVSGFGYAISEPGEIPQNAYYVRFGLLIANKNITQIEFGSIATPYEPYQSSTITLTNPITLNGIGNVQDEIVEKDGVFGKWKRFGTVDLGTLSWKYNSDNNNFNSDPTDSALPQTISGYTNCIASQYIMNNISGAYMSDGNIKIQDSLVYVKDTRYTDPSAFKTAMSGVTLIYELATPTFEPLPTADQIALRSLVSYDAVTYVDFVSDRYDYLSENNAWQQGSISNVGVYADSSTRIRTDLVPINSNVLYGIGISSGYDFAIHLYDANKDHLYSSPWVTTDKYTFSYANAEYVSINIRKEDDTNVTPSIIGSSCTLTFEQVSLDPDVQLEYGISKVGGYALQSMLQAQRNDLTYEETLEILGDTTAYGFHIDGNESDPSEMVTYVGQAEGMTPAYMDYTTGKFNYGSWGDVWFVRDTKPCILSQDGSVLAYLDKDDMTKTIYGNSIAMYQDLDTTNFMVEFPKIWYKVVPDANEKSGTVYISPTKLDSGYKDYAYIDYQGNHKEHFYMPTYNGSLVNGVMRSLPGMAVSKNLNAQTEINYCKANGDGWFTEDAGEVMLINFLLILLGKSTDTQTVFGRGIDTGDNSTLNAYRTGAGDTKGFFWGSNDGTQLCKVFAIENWIGLQWRRYAGDINASGTRLSKLCYGTEDGSTTFDYNLTGDGYVNVGATPSGTNSGYISVMKFTANGMYSKVSSGSATTYYTDGQWFNNSQTDYALRGGNAGYGLLCGALCVTLYCAPSLAWWNLGAALSYK